MAEIMGVSPVTRACTISFGTINWSWLCFGTINWSWLCYLLEMSTLLWVSPCELSVGCVLQSIIMVTVQQE